jgi:hypothetical protein
MTDLANPDPGPEPGPDPDEDSRWLPLIDAWFDGAHEDDHPWWVEGCPDCADRANRLEQQR